MAKAVDPGEIRKLHDALAEARDAAADELNRLAADPPETEEGFIARKTELMERWRTLDIMRVQVTTPAGHP